MNKRVFLMLAIISIVCLPGRDLQAKQVKEPCQCFCAFKPGLRDRKAKDRPFVATLTNSKGETFDLCLCAKRDLIHLQKNPALIDEITDDVISSASCCGQ